MARALHANNELDKAIEVYDAYLALVRVEWIYLLKANVLLDKQDYECDLTSTLLHFIGLLTPW